MNIVDNILYQCRLNPAAAAIIAPGYPLGKVSYGRLEQFIHNASRKTISLELMRGDAIALFVTDPVLHAAIALGFARTGVVTLSGRNPKLPADLDIAAVITDSGFPYQARRVIRADHSWLSGDAKPIPDDRLPKDCADDLCRIVLTSGTTGDAKPVGLTHDMLARRIGRHTTVFGSRLPQCARTFCDLGLATSLGFQFLADTLWRGGTFFFPGVDPASTLQAFEAFRVQNIVSAPASLAQWLRIYEDQPALQSNLETILSGGSLLSSALAQRLRARMCPQVICAYGSTEASMTAAAPAHMLPNVTGAVGFVMPGISVEIIDAAGKVLSVGQEGHVRVRGSYSVAGYLGTASATDEAFRNGWFHPGDIGRLTADRVLVVSGRDKLLVNLGGDKVKPEMVEEVIASFSGVDQVGVFSMVNELGIEELWSLIAARAALDVPTLRVHCEEQLPPTFIPVRFITVDSIPLNAMGKIERQRLPELAKSKLQ